MRLQSSFAAHLAALGVAVSGPALGEGWTGSVRVAASLQLGEEENAAIRHAMDQVFARTEEKLPPTDVYIVPSELAGIDEMSFDVTSRPGRIVVRMDILKVWLSGSLKNEEEFTFMMAHEMATRW